MKKVILLLAAGLFAGATIAQDLPQPSPSAKIEQTVGLSELTVDYSRPSVKGRTVFGDLVPYNEVWRLGANACTKLTSSTDLQFAGGTLKAGTYAVFAIPAEKGAWKILFNTDTEQWGAGNYKEEKNALVVEAKPATHAFTETFTISINDVTLNGATLSFTWDKLIVNVPFEVNTKTIAKKNIEEAIHKGEELDKVYYRAASYYHKSIKDDKMAMDYIEKGIKVKPSHALYFLKAQIKHEAGDTKEAIQLAEKAHKLALEAESKGWADYIAGTIAEWKK